jgi:mannose-1-phosphate guanylyltransferase / mannose-6-phosphate isomerase
VNLIPVILCGGSGTRLWPLSRECYPKQFHCFSGEHTLFEATVSRAINVLGVKHIVIVCNEAHRFMAANQAASVLKAHPSAITFELLLEPVARSTAPAMAAVAHRLQQEDIMVVMPSDQYVDDAVKFSSALDQAVNAAQQGYLCTFGITPTHAETGFGYIQAGAVIDSVNDSSSGGHYAAKTVQRFVEKPDQSSADRMFASGTHTWNSGIFVMQAGDFLAEILAYAPLVHSATHAASQKSISETVTGITFTQLNAAAFEQSPNISVDYAVFEHTRKAAVVAYDGGWSDLGSWAAVAQLQHSSQDAVDSPHVNINARNNHIHSDKAVAIVGLDDIVVVDTPDALLITRKAASQQVKDAHAAIKAKHPQLAASNRKMLRPWGWYDSVAVGQVAASNSQYQVKRIHVDAGQSLSLQSHQHRAEHWIVIQGIATVSVGSAVDTVSVHDYALGEHIHIPLHAVHRLENKTHSPVEIVEVQSGSYLGEDDIVRYQDVYGRK